MSEFISPIITGALVNIISATVIAVGGYLFTKKYVSIILFANNIKKLGFYDVSIKGQSFKEKRAMFKDAISIDIMNVSGFHFLNDNEEAVKEALQRGVKIRFLSAHPFNEFLQNIEGLENSYKTREEGKLISKEIFDLMDKYNGTGLLVRLYTSSYRLPLIIARYPDGKIKTWLTITLPPYKSTNSFMLKGVSTVDDDNEAEFIKMMEIHFNTIWNNASVSIEEYNNRIVSVKQSKWNKKLLEAKNNSLRMSKQSEKIIIEVAAQHPLINGELPNVEFKGRLDKAIDLSKKYNDVYFYVPGNIHVPDKISLSEAGVKYLLDNGISKDRIYGLEANTKYKGIDGVYNSTDECYVASKIFFENQFGRLICVCSPVQLMRKALSYISFGIYPEIETFYADEMFHNYVEEYFRNIPALINETIFDKKSISLESELLRKERKPL